jgi:hypothetical protein
MRHRFHPPFGKQGKNQGYFLIGSKRKVLRAFPDRPKKNKTRIGRIFLGVINLTIQSAKT